MLSADDARFLHSHPVDPDDDDALHPDDSSAHDVTQPLTHRPRTPSAASSHRLTPPFPGPPPRASSDPPRLLTLDSAPPVSSNPPSPTPLMLSSYYSSSRSSPNPSSYLHHPATAYTRTLLFCSLFAFICLCVFLAEYIYIDHRYHAEEGARHAQTAALLSSAQAGLEAAAVELEGTQTLLQRHEQRVVDLSHQLSQRDDALLMYRQLVTDLQEKSAATEAEQALKLQQAQLQASHLLNQTSYLFKKSEKATVETVTRVVDDSDAQRTNGSSPSTDAPEAVATKLVDSAHNEYILSNPTDSSLKTVDSRLILDLGIVIISAAIGGLLASLMQQPPLLGYLLAGSAIGPGGLRLIGQFVQVETLAEFGATFLLFALGVEFSFHRLQRVRRVAVGSGGLSMVIIVGLVGVLGWLGLGLTLGKGLFIGAVLSMSSTTVVVKSLMERRGELDSKVGQVMLGLLIVQDIALSLLLSIITLTSSSSDMLLHDVVLHLLKFLLLAAIVVCCAFLWPLALRMLDYSRSHDLFLLGLVALCVTLTVVADKVIGSAEVGAFLAGILVSSSPTASVELTKRSLRLFEPIRDMFGALFFSSMGMLINPAFLVVNWMEVLLLVALTVVLKTLVMYATNRLFDVGHEDALHIALCLSQIGEFAFVLASQGLRAGLLAREDYMLLLGVTAVSIFVTPGLIGGSFLIRRSWGKSEGEGRPGDGEVAFDEGMEERQRMALQGPSEAGAREADERRGKERDEEQQLQQQRRKEKRSDAELQWLPHLHPDEAIDSTRTAGRTDGVEDHAGEVDEEEGSQLKKPLTAYPLKRQQSRERAAAAAAAAAVQGTLEVEKEGEERSRGGWRERRKQRQTQRAKALAEVQKKAEARKHEQTVLSSDFIVLHNSDTKEQRDEAEQKREEEKQLQQEMRIHIAEERKEGQSDEQAAAASEPQPSTMPTPTPTPTPST